MSVTCYGASDDAVEVEGDIREEFTVPSTKDSDVVLAFSDGTALRIYYDRDGIWRITPLAQGTATLTIEQSSGDGSDDYSDRATLAGDVKWVVYGTQIAKK